MSVTAVIIHHGEDQTGPFSQANDMLHNQIVSPSEIIYMSCCTSGANHVPANKMVRDYEHVDDWGHRFCALGVAMASKEWLWLANSDDEYEPQFLQTLLQRAEDTGADLVACDYDTYQRHGDTIVVEPKVGSITRGNWIVRTEVAQQVGYNHREYIADGLFIEDVVASGAKVELVHTPHFNLMHHR